MKNIIYLLLIPLLLFACKDDDSYPVGTYFSLSETNIDFSNSAGEQSVTLINLKGEAKAIVTSEKSEWCEVSVANNTLSIKVSENILATSRTAAVEVTSGDEKVSLLVRQEKKVFSTIPAAANLEAIPGPGEITLKWTKPEQDNFYYVVISYEKKGIEYKIEVPSGVFEYTIKELVRTDGEVFFNVQSFDRDREPGPTVSASAVPGKLVAFRFEGMIDMELLPHYFIGTKPHISTLRIGSLEFNENEESIINFELDYSVLDKYNETAENTLLPLPSENVTYPVDYQYKATTVFQDMEIEVKATGLKNDKYYGIPLKIKSTSSATISEMMSSIVLIYHIDDLSGWYTVDRLPKSGSQAGSYPDDPEKRRRYIKRTGENSWETGYEFQSYSKNENDRGNGKSNVQFISINPDTKAIFVQQSDHAISESHNVYDPETNELHLEYLYRDWSGWWTHERMYNKSAKR